MGTNSTRLLVADVEDGRVRECERRSTVTRLGRGVDTSGHLAGEAIEDVCATVARYIGIYEGLGAERVVAIATSAVRDASNSAVFLAELRERFALDARILDGTEEARLTYLGASLERAPREKTLVFDIGGGSTELVVAGPVGVSWSRSLDIGSVRLTERFFHRDPPTLGDLAACAAQIRHTLPDLLDVEDAIGVAGTVTSLAAIALGLAEYDRATVHGRRLTLEAIEREVGRLAGMPLAERTTVPGLHPDRAPVIVAGGIIVRETLAHMGLDGLTVSERDILHGIALEAAELPEPVEGDAPPGAYTCC